MTKNWTPSLFTVIALSSASLLSGPAYSDVSTMSQSIQGAESDVKGAIQDVNARAISVLKDHKISQVGSSIEKSGETLTLSGKKGDMTIEIQLDAKGSNETHVGVIAKQSPIKWNKDYASMLLDQIVSKG